jgi:hypothetical protein
MASKVRIPVPNVATVAALLGTGTQDGTCRDGDAGRGLGLRVAWTGARRSPTRLGWPRSGSRARVRAQQPGDLTLGGEGVIWSGGAVV